MHRFIIYCIPDAQSKSKRELFQEYCLALFVEHTCCIKWQFLCEILATWDHCQNQSEARAVWKHHLGIFFLDNRVGFFTHKAKSSFFFFNWVLICNMLLGCNGYIGQETHLHCRWLPCFSFHINRNLFILFTSLTYITHQGMPSQDFTRNSWFKILYV